MKEVHILSLGAGVQSTALYLIRDYDYAIFADTGDEPEAVYRHLDWLKSLNRTPILVRNKGRLSEDLKKGQNGHGGRVASIPAFTKSPDGKIGMVRRQCSKEYKLEVIDRCLRREVLKLEPRQRLPKDITVYQYIGISLDEAGRAARLTAVKRPKQVKLVFPLLEKYWTRANCQTYLAGVVPHPVPRSACVYCPFHSDAEWLRIKSNPSDWKLAVEVDEGLRLPGVVINRKLDGQLFVHRSCKPLVQISFNENPTAREQQTNLSFAQECFGVCGV